MIITIGREFASKGNKIGELVAKKLGIKCFDKVALTEEAKKAGLYEEVKDFCNEELVNSLLFVVATSNYGNKQGKIPFEFVRTLAEKESCVIIGGCGNYIFREWPDAVSVFIHGPKEVRLKRVMEKNRISRIKAERTLENEDKAREGFHNYYTNEVWKAADGYHLTIDSSTMSEEDVADFIIAFAKMKIPK